MHKLYQEFPHQEGNMSSRFPTHVTIQEAEKTQKLLASDNKGVFSLKKV